MFDLVFLGTAAAVPSVDRGLPALYVAQGADRFLVDCGEGTQRQLLRAKLGFRGLRHVLLTHAHLDHIAGLAGLVATRALFGIQEPIEIIGSAETITYVGHYLALTVGGERAAGYQLRAVRPGLIGSWPGWRLQAFAVKHRRTQSLGYRFEEAARAPLLADRLAMFGVPAGRERRELAEGHSVTAADGRLITPEMVRGPSIAGTRLIVIGDVEEVGSLMPEVDGANVLVIEATYLDRDAPLARSNGHLTAAAAALLAQRAGAGELLLTHISGRYAAEEILAEAAGLFPNSRVVADFDRISVGAHHNRAAIAD
jgi:ribonuclease Z